MYLMTESGQIYGKYRTLTNFNSSSIAISKNILMKNIDYLRQTHSLVDIFYFIIASLDGGRVIRDTEPLTFYRVNSFNKAIRKEQDAHTRKVFERVLARSGNTTFASRFMAGSMRYNLQQKVYQGQRLRLVDLEMYLVCVIHSWPPELEVIRGVLIMAASFLAPHTLHSLYLKNNSLHNEVSLKDQ